MEWGLAEAEFVDLYWSVLGVAFLGSVGVMAWSRSAPATRDEPLDRYGVALLTGGWARVGHTALAGLIARGQVRVNHIGGLAPVSAARFDDPFEEIVLGGLATINALRFPGLRTSAAGCDLRERLAESGYLRRADRARRGGRVGWVFVGLFAVGLVRVVIGLVAGEPVGSLVLPLLATVFAWFAVVPVILSGAGSVRPTPRGHAALARAHRVRPIGQDSVAAVAFSGLSAHPDPEMRRAFRHESAQRPASDSRDRGSPTGDSGGI